MKITKPQWQQIEPLFTTALAMDAIARAPWLAEIERTNTELAPLLKQLLATHDAAERASELETVPKLAPPPPLSAFLPGEMVGAYRLVRPLGRGGMGEVWLADQADGRLTRQVALKLPTQVQHLEVWRRRFQRERDILARLAHPHIAHLFDAGVDDKLSRIGIGQPYLALEYVEGQPLNEYVNAKALPLRARLKLFQQVLAATAHAHQHLVVHRDLKPGNILVTAVGEVKLLDFGIAKLLGDATEERAAANLTQISGRVMTLRYAAPEQLSGGVISTATDAYALGVILHELVTGLSPYRVVREQKALTETAMLAEPVCVPSSIKLGSAAANERGFSSARLLSRAINGDLDAIILKALRRNPADRYTSIALFNDDIQRHLESRPVKARDGTWRYLASRFVARYKLPIAAGAAILMTLVAGVVMVEQQRRVAEAEKARAEKHFASVRKLANSIMFDVQGDLEPVPGTLKARQKLAATSLAYLDNLSTEAGSDAGLALELSTAYRKLAGIQGTNSSENVGQETAAITNTRKAQALLQPIISAQPDRLDALRELIAVERNLTLSLFQMGDKAALPEAEAAVELSQRLQSHRDATDDDKRYLATAYLDLGKIHAYLFNDLPSALTKMAAGVAIFETLASAAPTDLQTKTLLAGGYALEAFLLGLHEPGKEQLARALERRDHAQTLFASILVDKPNDARARLAGCILSTQSALAHEGLGNSAAAVNALRAGIKCAREFASRDSASFVGPEMVAEAQSKLALLLERLARLDEALAMANDALATIARLPPDVKASFNGRHYKAFANEAIGRVKCFAPGNNVATRREGRVLIVERLALAQEIVEKKMGSLEANPVQKMEKVLADCDTGIARASK